MSEQAASNVDWIDKFDMRTGLDQLGMRLASEAQYAQLVDFTTTVTWHPRYYSFLAWATRKAFSATREGDGVRLGRWREMVRRLDYLVAAATLARSRAAGAIIGSEKLGPRLDEAVKTGGPLPIGDDHVGDQDGTGSLEVYGGSMTALGLMGQKDGVSIPTEFGVSLADAFERCVAATGVQLDAVVAPISVAQDDLVRLGTHCGLDHLGGAAETIPEVVAERDLLRARILDWGRFDDAQRPEGRWRIQSIGLVLACHRHMGGGDTTRATFREAILTGGVRNRGPLALSRGFDEVRRYWRLYQAHANVVFALESLLSLALAFLYSEVPRHVVLRAVALDALDKAISADHDPWWDRRLADLISDLETRVRADPCDEHSEPAIDTRLRRRRRGPWSDRMPAASDAARLLLWSLARMRTLGDEVKTAWLGRAAAWRRTPASLVAHVSEALATKVTTREYLRAVVDDLVLRQHTRNVYRKLAEQHGRSTALFHTDGAGLEFVAHHPAGTTTPRFDNSAEYLADLGYLGGKPYVLTPDGERLLERIAARSAT